MGKVTCSKCPKVFDSEIEYNLHWSHNHSGVASASLVQTEPVDVAVEVAPVIIAEEPNYKDSQKIIGQLYPVLKSKDGQVIDGFHRLAVDPNWKSVVLSEVDTEEKLLVARAVSNWHRRQVSREEKAKWINGLAELYQKQGFKSRNAQSENEIKNKIAEVTGLSPQTVGMYLSAEFKQEPSHIEDKPKIPASERVETQLGKEVAERFRKEVLAEQKLSPEEKAKHDEQVKLVRAEKERKKAEQKAKKEEDRKQLEEKIRKEVVKRDLAEVKSELLKDPSFQREGLHEANKTQIEESTEASVEIENTPTNTKTQQIVKEMIEEYLPAIKEAYKKIKPEKNHEPERNKLILNMLLKNLEQGLIFCPICDQQMLECSHCHTSLSKMKEDTRI